MVDSAHVLIVDDDRQIRTLLRGFLRPEGFRVTTVADGGSMMAAIERGGIDLVVLDVMLPGDDGLSLCRQLRRTSRVPVIMLTALASETERVAGLELGADDYLAKPFSARELLARIRAVLRRTAEAAVVAAGREDETVRPLRFAGWTVDLTRRQLRSPEGVLVELTGGEFDLLVTFLQHPGQVLPRDWLLDRARGRMAGPADRTIDVHVGRLRRKLGDDPKSPQLIKTVRGGGYVLTAAVEG